MNAQAKWIEKEQREREARERLAQLAQEIGAELGAGVSDIPREGCEAHPGHWYLNLPEGGQVSLSLNWRDEADGKLIASWHRWAEGPHGFRYTPGDCANYTERSAGLPSFDARIAMNKGAARIAKEITTRVIEVSRPWYERTLQRAAQHSIDAALAKNNAAMFAAKIGAVLEDRHMTDAGRSWTIWPRGEAAERFPFYCLIVRAYNGNVAVTFERLDSMAPDKAARLIEAMAAL